jgi:hypothetical protein
MRMPFVRLRHMIGTRTGQEAPEDAVSPEENRNFATVSEAEAAQRSTPAWHAETPRHPHKCGITS